MELLFIGLGAGLAIGSLAVYLCMRKIASRKIDKFISEFMWSSETIGSFIRRHLTAEDANDFVNGLKTNLSCMIYNQITDKKLSEDVSKKAVERICKTLTPNSQVKEQSRFGRLGQVVGTVVDAVREYAESSIEKNRDVIEKVLSDKLNEVMRNGNAFVSNIVNSGVERILAMPVSSLLEGNEQTVAVLKKRIMSMV